MSLITIIYLVDTIPGMLTSTLLILGLGLILSGVVFFAQLDYCDDENKESKYYKGKRLIKSGLSFKPYLILFSALLFISSLTPSSNTAYKMLAAYGVQEISKTEEMRNLGGKSLEVLDKAMSEYLGSEESE